MVAALEALPKVEEVLAHKGWKILPAFFFFLFSIVLYTSILQNTCMTKCWSDILLRMENISRKLERVIKGFANYRRIQILELLKKKTELSVQEIADELAIGYENASDHIRKMAIAGLVLKRYEGNNVRHCLTDRAKTVLIFCKEID